VVHAVVRGRVEEVLVPARHAADGLGVQPKLVQQRVNIATATPASSSSTPISTKRARTSHSAEVRER
jgi:DNA-binding transcriptional regulator YdaS (Cro superfamily)